MGSVNIKHIAGENVVNKKCKHRNHVCEKIFYYSLWVRFSRFLHFCNGKGTAIREFDTYHINVFSLQLSRVFFRLFFLDFFSLFRTRKFRYTFFFFSFLQLIFRLNDIAHNFKFDCCSLKSVPYSFSLENLHTWLVFFVI